MIFLDFVPGLSALQEMVRRGSYQTVLLLREDFSRMAFAEQHHQKWGRITFRRRDLWRVHNNMRGVVYSVPDGRVEEQQKNCKSAF